jgi:heme oxygenase
LLAKSDIRTRLRKSTAAVHERLHRHEGFAAVADGTIDLIHYQRLLSRLWGFHYPFETTLRQVNCKQDIGVEFETRGRSRMLESDLAALGWDRASVVELPQCKSLRAPDNAAEFMGSLYVVEGSTLGGLQLANALRSLVVSDSGDGRSFFLGYGDRHGAMWRSFLSRLEDFAHSEADGAAVIDGAIRTFVDFENWMAGWNRSFKTEAVQQPTESALRRPP